MNGPWSDQGRERYRREKRRQKERRRRDRKRVKGIRRAGRALRDWW
jgi:hypothetical protein